ncbi:hypothetical protein ABMA28_008645 [Loxostege sticticalis]|uniref:Glucosylceramidase n=1 Tax=Loxostege sticticalis TaxID=481309 RepID=A0ABD0SE49_LOXSC
MCFFFQEGLRFSKVRGLLQEAFDGTFPLTTLKLNVNEQYQTIEGFGGAITDAAAINWLRLANETLRQNLIESYFNPDTGLGYNTVRMPIGGSDFPTRKYALNELPKYDKLLTNFSLAYEDYHHKIPMYKAAQSVSKGAINIVATTWSPPDWMKVSNGISVCGKLNPDYYQTYADYHLKFIEAYHNEGIDVWAITTTNEPANSFIAAMTFNCLGWSSSDQARWIVENLGPTISSSKFNNTMILVNDDQRYSIPFLFNELVASNPAVLDYIDGVAVHAYADSISSPSTLESITKPYPDLKLLVTEFCEGFRQSQRQKVDLGAWDRAETYINTLFENLNYGAVGYIDWNLCLDKVGGPNWSLNFVDSPIIVFPEVGQFVKQPYFYVMGHFSKFVPRGSKRIGVDITKTAHDIYMKIVAFLTPENTVVVILYNPSNETRCIIKLGSQAAYAVIPAQALVTLEMVVDESSFEPAAVNTGPGGPPENIKAAVSDNFSSDTDPQENLSPRKSRPKMKTPSNSPSKSPTRNRKRPPTPIQVRFPT